VTSNKSARKKLRNCISDLWLSRSNGRTPDQIDGIDDNLTKLEEEYFALGNKKPGAKYAELTGQLTAAADGLTEIKENRDQFTNGLVTASKLLGSITSTLGLLS